MNQDSSAHTLTLRSPDLGITATSTGSTTRKDDLPHLDRQSRSGASPTGAARVVIVLALGYGTHPPSYQ